MKRQITKSPIMTATAIPNNFSKYYNICSPRDYADIADDMQLNDTSKEAVIAEFQDMLVNYAGYEVTDLIIAKPKYFDALANNGIDVLMLIDGQVYNFVANRLIPQDIEEVEDCCSI